MNPLQKIFIKQSVQMFLRLQATLFTRPSLHRWGQKLNHWLAHRTIRHKKITPATTLYELGLRWQQGFPAAKQVPIVGQDDRTLFAEIHTPCPLRGTGVSRHATA
jgi:hypothetical protein